MHKINLKNLAKFAAALALAATATTANAASTDVDVIMNYLTPVATSQTQGLTFRVIRVPAKAGVYTANDLGYRAAWDASKITPAQVEITGAASAAVAITAPATVVLTKGADTATMGVDLWVSDTSAPATPAGSYTSGNSVNLSATGGLFLAVTPSTLNFGNDVIGTGWAGVVNIATDYL